MKAIFAYLSVAFVGLVVSYNMNIFQPEIVQASEIPKTINLPPLQGNFNMNLDLETGNVNVESNLPFASTDVTVNHPTKIVEKVVYKPGKERIKYETKVEYREKLLMFPLPAKRLHVPQYSIPSKVE